MVGRLAQRDFIEGVQGKRNHEQRKWLGLLLSRQPFQMLARRFASALNSPAVLYPAA